MSKREVSEKLLAIFSQQFSKQMAKGDCRAEFLNLLPQLTGKVDVHTVLREAGLPRQAPLLEATEWHRYAEKFQLILAGKVDGIALKRLDFFLRGTTTIGAECLEGIRTGHIKPGTLTKLVESSGYTKTELIDSLSKSARFPVHLNLFGRLCADNKIDIRDGYSIDESKSQRLIRAAASKLIVPLYEDRDRLIAGFVQGYDTILFTAIRKRESGKDGYKPGLLRDSARHQATEGKRMHPQMGTLLHAYRTAGSRTERAR